MPLDRDACERRAYRLAMLLVGEPEALPVMERVLAAQPHLETLDGAHLDRLTILACRESQGQPPTSADLPRPAVEALATLTHQEHEAWVLARVHGCPLRETARAMDCSVTATRRHLARATERMGDGAAETAASLRAFVVDLDLPQVYRRRRRGREQTRRLLMVLGWVTLAATLLAVVTWLLGGP